MAKPTRTRSQTSATVDFMELYQEVLAYGEGEAWSELNYAQRVRAILRLVLVDKLPYKVEALKRVLKALLMGVAPDEGDAVVVAEWLDFKVEALYRLTEKVIDSSSSGRSDS